MSPEEFNFLNSAFYDEQFRAWQKNPASVDPSWQKAFTAFEKNTSYTSVNPTLVPPVSLDKLSDPEKENDKDKIRRLAAAWRRFGHLMADTNPLEPPTGDFEGHLNLARYDLTDKDFSKVFPTLGIFSKEEAPLSEIVAHLKAIYGNKTGYEFFGIVPLDEEKWFISQLEGLNGEKEEVTLSEKQMILEQLSKSELLEIFMHTKYVGQKRFSLEGAESLIPMMEEVVEEGAEQGIKEFVIGMAHRGRLNVLSNILNKSYKAIFSEFEEGYLPESKDGIFDSSGDVKYHKGYESIRSTPQGHTVKLTLMPNPSHLESVDGVVEGEVRGKQDRLGNPEAHNKIMPILVHGDAAIAGQGVVYETLQMQGLAGYTTGGTLHFVINNQIGFTTTPKEGRSTLYCTDIAKTFRNPVIHVNGEDPEGAVAAVKLAMRYRQKFHRDIFIDLICWRKYGHNEGDEPLFTQPSLYRQIKEKKPIRDVYRDKLIQSGLLEQVIAEAMEKEFKKALQETKESLSIKEFSPEIKRHVYPPYTPSKFKTSVSIEELQEVGKVLSEIPKEFKRDDFQIHPKVEGLIKDRFSMYKGEKPIDWGMGEMLAYGTLLIEGKPIRISGQDVERGTFSHRHATWVDQRSGNKWAPLSNLRFDQGSFYITNSHLSEFAVLGFEYGYSLTIPEGLTIWESQFGDFANGAQVVIDQYLASAEQKWGQRSNVTLFLPHGYEGQGPEHSSGRIERFLSLTGNDNLRVVVPTSPHQHFHLLRRQALDSIKKPLAVFTPKALLRHPACVSSLKDFTEGRFEEIIDDPEPVDNPKKLIFCSGKIYYDLKAYADKIKDTSSVFVRIEQLYPLYDKKILDIAAKYHGVREVLWVQEEPQNMGAANYIVRELERILTRKIHYVGRETSASPATGIYVFHKKEVQDIMEEVFSKDRPTTYEIAGHIRA